MSERSRAGCVGVVVERVEVVVHEVDLGPLRHPEPEPEEDFLDLAARRGEQVQPSRRPRR